MKNPHHQPTRVIIAGHGEQSTEVTITDPETIRLIDAERQETARLQQAERDRIVNDLRQFTGTERYYRHTLSGRAFKYTDGVKYLADTAGAYWLIDEIVFSNQAEIEQECEGFQSWKLKLGENNTAVLTCDDGNSNVVYRKDITFTDFPLPEIELWVEGGDVILLPSEH